MISEDPYLAPIPELLRYLAVFRRTFVAIANYTLHDDKPGILLGGWLADALHNVPGMLRRYKNYSPDDWNSPARLDAWMQQFPDEIRKFHAPERLIEDCQHILAGIDSARELRLRDDLSDLDLAPSAKLHAYLDVFYHACLYMRFMRNYGNRFPAPWNRLEQVWTEKAAAQAARNEQMATILQPIPQGLVHWEQFDERQFREAWATFHLSREAN